MIVQNLGCHFGDHLRVTLGFHSRSFNLLSPVMYANMEVVMSSNDMYKMIYTRVSNI
jgi:hypothetical protein